MLNRFACFSSAALLLLAAGCGDSIDTVPVTGTITLDGTPIQGASVTFQPVEGGTGHAAVGTTDANGTFQLTDMRSDEIGSGAVPGEYRVGVLWFKPTGEDTSSATGESSGEEAADESRTARQSVSGPEALLPGAYQNPKTSGLTATVADGGENSFDFALDSKFKGGQ